MIKTVYVPVRIISEANTQEHWGKKHKRHKFQKMMILGKLKELKEKPTLPVHITLTRVAPRSLDYDNLVASQKKSTDIVADFLIPNLPPGRADGDPRLSFSYEQKKGQSKVYGLEITIEELSKKV